MAAFGELNFAEISKTGFEGYEELDRFSAEELEEYRTWLVQKSEIQAKFIAARMPDKFSVIEFCSGNGRLLVTLSKSNALSNGLALEISKSRVKFAEKWRQDWDLNNFKNITADVLTYKNYPFNCFDIALCITAGFQFLYPVDEAAPMQVLHKLRNALKPGGALILELYQLTDQRRQLFELNNNTVKIWQELPAADKFRFYLLDMNYFPDVNVAYTKKTFIARDGTIDEGKAHAVTYYSASQITEMLRTSGFGFIEIFANFEQEKYLEGESAAMVVVAQRIQGTQQRP